MNLCKERGPTRFRYLYFSFYSVLGIRIRIRRIREFFGFLDPDPDPSIFYGSGSILKQAKKVRKTLISNVLWLPYDFLYLKTDVNVLSTSNKQKLWKYLFFVAILKATDEKSWIRIRKSVYDSVDPDPDPYQNVTDLQHCFCILGCQHTDHKIP